MKMLLSAFVSISVAVLTASEKLDDLGRDKFPNDFQFGVATSAYQIEGAWNTDGKGPSVWDELTHSEPHRIKNQSNADIAANSYEFFMDDVQAVKNLSMDYYRFSIAWSRVLPTGDISNINEKGIEYYNKLINKLLEMNIEPMVTMYHWDHPQNLQKLGGFTNSGIVNYFKEYANLLFERFGDRVKYWITFNEAFTFCYFGYSAGYHAPALRISGVGEYLCGHNVLKAHAVTYHLYKQSFYDRFKGQIGMSLQSMYFYSETIGLDDRALQFMLGWFAAPIFSSKGNYPSVMIERINRNSALEGRIDSRLPTFSKKWIDLIRGSADFFGLNYYTSRHIEEMNVTSPTQSFVYDASFKDIQPDEKRGSSSFLYSYPQGLGDLLRWIKKEYNNPTVFITENGWSDEGEIEDNDRIEYLHDHLHHTLGAILNDGCNVKGYTVWSAIDNFEWTSGYTETFGLYAVNFTSPRKERIPKKSAKFMKIVAETHQIPNIN